MEEQIEKKLNTLASEISCLFSQYGLSLACAESFTGGKISSSIVAIPGASTFLREGLVCYSNEAKRLRLGVAQETLDKYGAVSEQTAEEMIRGLLNSPLYPDFAVATTGNAGPGVEPKSQPGECYVAAGNKEIVTVEKITLLADREDNIKKGAAFALETLLNLVKKLRGI